LRTGRTGGRALGNGRSNKLIGSVKKAWRTTLKRAGASYFPIYNLRHVFCTRLSWVAPDAIVQRAMRHSSPETKRVYQLGLVHQVREHMERANDEAYQGREALHLRDSASREECAEKMEACN
jgi:integrase